MKTNWRYQIISYRDRFLVYFHTPIFITMLLLFWLAHVLFFGWFNYLFNPKMYVIRAGLVNADMEHDRKGTPWWNRHDCDAARYAAMVNDPDTLLTFVWRTHPLFLDNEYMYVNSPNWKARIWNERTKVYQPAK